MFNSSINVYKTEWLDLVFANRNKRYGAYELRSKSSSIMTKALFSASAVFLLLFFSPLIYSKISLKEKVNSPSPKTTVVSLAEPIREMKKPEEKKGEPAKAKPVKVKTIALPSKIVVVDKTELADPPTIKELKIAVIADQTQDGLENPNLVIANNNGAGNGVETTEHGTSKENETEIYTAGVDEYPEFVGGVKAWSKYMERNLRYPLSAQEDAVQGKVFVSFVVEKNGSITDVTVTRGIGFGCDEEAMKVIKKSPLWKPGRNNGNPVRVRYNMAINFQML